MSNILIVEDSVLIAKVIKTILEKENFSVFHTSKGKEVVDIIKKQKIDLVILDLMMPEVDGYEVFKLIKSEKSLNDVKIMILTAKTDALRWNSDLNNCDYFMKKPFDNADLVKQVKNLLHLNSKKTTKK